MMSQNPEVVDFSNIVWKNLPPKINIQNIGSLLDETTLLLYIQYTVQNFSLPNCMSYLMLVPVIGNWC